MSQLALRASALRTTRRIIPLVFVLSVIGLSTPASAYTQDQQMACQDDAFRLCGTAIPDESRVRACLVANVRQLSPACYRIFRPQSRTRHRHHRR